jgi:predicted transposase/invertase (TIGR01784 family)
MSLAKYLDPKNDVAFRRIFGTIKNKDILIRFLNDVIPFPDRAQIQDVSFPPPVQDPEILVNKQSIVDVLCQDQHGHQYIVEMQVASTKGFRKRAQYYAAKVYASQMKQGDPYEGLKGVIFLAITDFILFPELKSYRSDHLILEKSTRQHLLKDFYFCFLELPKFKKKIDELTTIVEKWAYFFKNAPQTTPKEIGKVAGSDKILRKAYGALNEIYWTRPQYEAYEAALKNQRDLEAMIASGEDRGFQRGKAEGMAEGKAEGKAEGEVEGETKATKKLVKRLLQLGYDIEAIQKVTDLSPKEIAKL